MPKTPQQKRRNARVSPIARKNQTAAEMARGTSGGLAANIQHSIQTGEINNALEQACKSGDAQVYAELMRHDFVKHFIVTFDQVNCDKVLCMLIDLCTLFPESPTDQLVKSVPRLFQLVGSEVDQALVLELLYQVCTDQGDATVDVLAANAQILTDMLLAPTRNADVCKIAVELLLLLLEQFDEVEKQDLVTDLVADVLPKLSLNVIADVTLRSMTYELKADIIILLANVQPDAVTAEDMADLANFVVNGLGDSCQLDSVLNVVQSLMTWVGHQDVEVEIDQEMDMDILPVCRGTMSLHKYGGHPVMAIVGYLVENSLAELLLQQCIRIDDAVMRVRTINTLNTVLVVCVDVKLYHIGLCENIDSALSGAMQLYQQATDLPSAIQSAAVMNLCATLTRASSQMECMDLLRVGDGVAEFWQNWQQSFKHTVALTQQHDASSVFSQLQQHTRASLMTLLGLVVNNAQVVLQDEEVSQIADLLVAYIGSAVSGHAVGGCMVVEQHAPTMFEAINSLIDLFAPDTYNHVYSSEHHKRIKTLLKPLQKQIKSINVNMHEQMMDRLAQQVDTECSHCSEWIDATHELLDLDLRQVKERAQDMVSNLQRFIHYKDQSMKLQAGR